MKKTRCIIVGAGTFASSHFHVTAQDWLIAADGGLNALSKIKLRPHLVIGDMDSVKAPVQHLPYVRYPVKKDDTDLSLALKIAHHAGCRNVTLYGITGTRLDHTYGVFQLMVRYAQKGVRISAVFPHGSLHCITAGVHHFPCAVGCTVSVFCPSGKAEQVSSSGLLYPLRNHTLTDRFPLGVSNRAIKQQIKISVRKGTLMVFFLESGL